MKRKSAEFTEQLLLDRDAAGDGVAEFNIEDLNDHNSECFNRKLNKNDEINNVALVDPGDVVNLGISKEHFNYFIFEHGIDIPLGIGFSIFALPLLIRGRLWKQLLTEVDGTFAQLTGQDLQSLDSLGIRLDLNVLPRTREACIDASLAARPNLAKQDPRPSIETNE